jgi:hypothetical protein
MDVVIQSKDGTNFTNLLKNLNLLDKHEDHFKGDKRNHHYNNRHFRYKKNLEKPKSELKESDPDYTLKVFTQALVGRKISPTEYKDVLREHNINPNVEAVKIFI